MNSERGPRVSQSTFRQGCLRDKFHYISQSITCKLLMGR